MADKSKIPLADLISNIRAELIKANDEAEGKELQFLADEVELELKIGVTKDVEVNAGVEIWVLSLGGSGDYKNEQVQTVRLKLKPVGKNGGPWKTSKKNVKRN